MWPSDKKNRFISIIAVLLVVSILLIIWRMEVTLNQPWQPRSVRRDLPGGKKGKLIKYGYDLITQTYKYIGPDVRNASMRFAGNNLACQNCHLNAGRKPGSGSFVGVYNRYPGFRSRSGKTGTIEDRINGCMQRSMNGKPLNKNSREMKAMVAYMKWLSTNVPSSQVDEYKGFDTVILPNRAADTTRGRLIYIASCQRCHGSNGQGHLNDNFNPRLGYQYPPLWGPNSFNNGAGMDRVITAARFIKGNMPYGVESLHPLLKDGECFDVAAYIDSHSRPHKNDLSSDYPDRKLKPIDCPYGPYADTFSQKQHRFGPYDPIKEFYLKKYNIK